MKLYLSSFHLGDKTDRLKSWIDEVGDNKIFLIPNAMDVFPDGERKNESLLGSVKELEEVGFNVAMLDLKDYFGKKEKLQDKLKDAHTIFARGGNAFALRLAMKFSGFDEYLIRKIGDDDLLYGSYSAGMCVLGPTMRGLELVDDANIEPYGAHDIIWDGIGLIDFVPVPHFESDHPESEMANGVVEYLQSHNTPYKTLRDGDVIIMEV